jgi:oligopeptide/dipeptide ABC transporter ATP-binding protein
MPDDGEPGDRLVVIDGTVPSPTALPAGCRFGPRCPRAIDACRTQEPPLLTLGSDHAAACIRALDAAA